MINFSNTSALRRRNRGIVSAAVALGALIAPAPGFAQGPPLPPPPPDLDGPAAPNNGGNGNAGGGVTLPVPTAIPGGVTGPKPTFTPQIQGGFTVSVPTLLQGTVSSVNGTVIVLNVPTGLDTKASRRLQLEDASFANAQGKPIEKFKVAKGDSLVVILDPASEHATHDDTDTVTVTPPPTRVLVVEKSVAAAAVKKVAATK
jgi:hypothetical protein